jgi:hypothetical protein
MREMSMVLACARALGQGLADDGEDVMCSYPRCRTALRREPVGDIQ